MIKSEILSLKPEVLSLKSEVLSLKSEARSLKAGNGKTSGVLGVKDIKERTYQFSLKIICLCRDLMTDITNRTVAKQVLRSGTSIGANIEEAYGGLTKPDFTHSMNIARKEARETYYWLRLIRDARCSNLKELTNSINESEEILKILTAIVKKAQLGLIVLLLQTSSFRLQTCYAAEVPSMQFLLLRKDVRAVAMGDAFAALSDDVGALSANPAGMVFLEKTHLQASGNMPGVLGDPLMQVSLIYPDKDFNNAWGLHAAQLSLAYDAYDTYGNLLTDQSADVNQTAGLSYAHHIGIHWALGISLQYAMETLNDKNLNSLPGYEATGFLGNLGLIYATESDRWRFGVLAYNMGGMNWDASEKAADCSDSYISQSDPRCSPGYQRTTSPSGSLPSGVRLGVAHRLLANKNLTIALDRDQASYANGASINLGLEWRLGKHFDLRGGCRSAKERLTPSFGVGLRLGRIVLDLAAASDASLGGSLALSFAWWFSGKAAAEEGAVRRVDTGGKKLNIAVADLRAVNVSETEAVTVSEFLRTGLVNTGTFRVIDRANMEKIMTEQKFQQTGCTSEECAVQMGKVLNVQKIVTGTVSNLKGTYYLQASVMDVEKGEIEVSQGSEAGSVKDLKAATDRLARKIESAYR
ncbi:MAG: four helix bundle protein [Elusimicrobia bacterium]|nr:four helix bundle protein [Elusimicrobiota bacterium]